MTKIFFLLLILFVSCTNVKIKATRNIQLNINRINIGSFNALKFPSNGDAPADTFIAFEYNNPQKDGLPIWGPDKRGTSFIWEYYPIQQKGYYVTFWWANNGPFQWMNGNTNSYYGCHPYPLGGAPGGQTTFHNWELAGMKSGADNIMTLSGNPLPVEKGRWYTQAFKVEVNKDGTKTGRFYIDLPDTSEDKIIKVKADKNWGELLPPNPALIFGDAPWGPYYYGTERLSGLLGRIKIFNKALKVNDLISEAMDMTHLVTETGEKNIWWGKTSFKTIDDLTCDYGTNRQFNWSSPVYKPHIVNIQDNILSNTIALNPINKNENSEIQIPIFYYGPNSLIKDIKLLQNGQFTLNFRNLPFNVSSGDSILVKINFNPDSVGVFKDTLLVFTSSYQKPYRVYLKASSLPIATKIKKTGRGVDRYSIILEFENPFQTVGTLNYVLQKTTNVKFTIYDYFGDRVRTLVDEKSPEGHYSIKWDGKNNENIPVKSGIYFVFRKIGNKKHISKFALIH